MTQTGTAPSLGTAAPTASRLIASPWHTLLVLAVQGYLAYRGAARVSHSLANPDRMHLYGRTILFEWLVLGFVLLGVWLHSSSLHSVMGERWHSLRQMLIHLGIGVAFLMGSILLGSILNRGIERSSARAILPQTHSEMVVWILLSLSAGICEEALYRGYLQRQFIAVARNVPAGILLSAALFGLAHSYQGAGQALQIAVLGLMSGVLAYWCKSVRPGMIAHVLQDVMGGLLRHG
jgi:membrane protease YdiL (CAAX protease family)